MAMGTIKFSVRMNGLEDIKAKMLTLGNKVALKVVRGGMKDGAVEIQKRAVQNLRSSMSIRTGALQKSVIVRTGKANGPNRLSQYEEWAGVTIAPTVFAAALDEGLFGKLVVVGRNGRAPKGTIKPRAYAHLIEFGVAPHSTGKGSRVQEKVQIFKRDKRGRMRKIMLATGRKGKEHGRPHPGFAARPFMRPAFDSGQFPAHAAMVASVRRRLMEAIAPWDKRRAS